MIHQLVGVDPLSTTSAHMVEATTGSGAGKQKVEAKQVRNRASEGSDLSSCQIGWMRAGHRDFLIGGIQTATTAWMAENKPDLKDNCKQRLAQNPAAGSGTLPDPIP
ncbi:MAG: hypothetical protein ACK5JT_09355 [Hyphomicrobiaceae bacterium]